MKIFLLGADGQLGHELCGALGCFAEVIRATEADFDMTVEKDLLGAIDACHPDVIVNAAAYTNVDGAEKDEETARAVNASAVAVLGRYALRARKLLVHYSTDFVFDGTKQTPYVEDDPPNPLGAYGQTKLEGEQALVEMGAPAITFRTAWVYSTRCKSFVSRVLELARERESLRMVDDQIGNPTFCRDLAQASALVIYGLPVGDPAAIEAVRGIYHLAGGDSCSRFELAKTVIELDPRRDEHMVRELSPIPSSEYPLPAARPLYAPLDCDKARRRFGVALPHWRDALARALAG